MNSDTMTPEELNEAYEVYAEYWSEFTLQIKQGFRSGNAEPITFQQFLARAT